MNDDAIEMTPEHLKKARELAEASSRPTAWGEILSSAVAKLVAETAPLATTQWVAFLTDANEEDWITAVTGNGEASRANAEFYASARGVVLGLLDALDASQNEVTELRREFAALETRCSELERQELAHRADR